MRPFGGNGGSLSASNSGSSLRVADHLPGISGQIRIPRQREPPFPIVDQPLDEGFRHEFRDQ